jgi:hypothetical protein
MQAWRVAVVCLVPLATARGIVVRAEPASSPAGASAADSESAGQAARYIAAWVEAETARAEAEAYQAEAEALREAADRGAEEHAAKGLEAVSADEREALTAIVENANEAAAQKARQAADEVRSRWRELEQQWLRVRAQLFEQKGLAYAAQLQSHEAGQWASLLSVDNRWLWFGGFAAVAAVFGVLWHYRRHEWRRWRHGSKARGLVLTKLLLFVVLPVLGIVTIGVFLGGRQIYELLLSATGAPPSPQRELEEDIADLQKQAQEWTGKREAAQRQRDGALKAWRPTAGPLAADAEAAYGAVRDLRVALLVERQYADALAADRSALAAVGQQVRDTSAQVAQYEFKRQLIAGLLGLGLFGLAGTFGGLFARAIRRHKKEMRETCPRCLQHGTFEAADENVGNGRIEPTLICRHQVSEMPYEECEFTFPAAYRDLDKLCFPCLGATNAGKTHWLLTAYRDLNRGAYDSECQFQRLRNRASELFDRFVDETLRQRFSTANTQPGLAHPLVFNFLDRDRWGTSNVLINILDFSGEAVSVDRDVTIQWVRRALHGDGYLFLLDPTDSIERQQLTLDEFRDRVRAVRRLSVGRQLESPVALCLTKIDMLLSQPYAATGGDDLVRRFYRELGEVGWQMDLESIEARSRLVARVKDLIWPGWQLERQVRELFGERFMFFPLTPVGLNGIDALASDELMDLSRRVIQPVGLVDPLLWLIHMNGYPVLK